MKTLTIKDLAVSKELDRKALSEVTGGMYRDLSALLAIASPFISSVANDQYNISAQSASIGGGNLVNDGVFAPVQFQWNPQSNQSIS